MESPNFDSRVSAIARWILVVPASMLGGFFSLVFLAVFVLFVWPWLWMAHGPEFVPGFVVAGSIWGGSIMAPSRHWSVRICLFAVAYYVVRPTVNGSPAQLFVGGLVGMGLVSFFHWFWPRVLFVRAHNLKQGKILNSYIATKRKEGMSFPSLAILYMNLSFPSKKLSLPDDAPKLTFLNAFTLKPDCLSQKVD